MGGHGDHAGGLVRYDLRRCIGRLTQTERLKNSRTGGLQPAWLVSIRVGLSGVACNYMIFNALQISPPSLPLARALHLT